MAERRHKQETQKAPKTYNIKMPVYTTSMMEQEEGLFGRVTYQDMISLLKERLKSFSSPISTDNRNKTKKMVINKITPIDVVIGDVPSLLLQINAFNTNLYDGYFEASEKIAFSKDNKIGSDSNFVLFYPRIIGLQEGHYTCYFLMLAYEDPTKDAGEVSRLAKIVANKILNVPVQNIKLEMILSGVHKNRSHCGRFYFCFSNHKIPFFYVLAPCKKTHKACCKKYKPYILKYKALILK